MLITCFNSINLSRHLHPRKCDLRRLNHAPFPPCARTFMEQKNTEATISFALFELIYLFSLLILCSSLGVIPLVLVFFFSLVCVVRGPFYFLKLQLCSFICLFVCLTSQVHFPFTSPPPLHLFSPGNPLLCVCSGKGGCSMNGDQQNMAY